MKDGTINFQHEAKINSHRSGMIFALTAHAELYAQGYSDRDQITGQEFALIGLSNCKDPVVFGLVLWELDEEDDTARVALVAVNKGYRRQGIFSAIWDEARLIMRDQGAKAIHCFVAKHNLGAVEAYKKVGMELDAFYMVQPL